MRKQTNVDNSKSENEVNFIYGDIDFASALATMPHDIKIAYSEFNPSEDYINTINIMKALFDFWNKIYFDNQLVMPVITIQQDIKGRAYGWFVPRKVWTTGRDCESSEEINISAQWLNRPLDEIAGTMLHELCHYFAYVHGYRDTSRYGYYHNQQFRNIAERHGLVVENTGRYHGWCKTELSEGSKQILKQFVQNGKILYDLRPGYSPSWFGSAMGEPCKKRKPSSTRKLTCPLCGISVRATKEVHIICGECKVALISERNDLHYDPKRDMSLTSLAAEPKT